MRASTMRHRKILAPGSLPKESCSPDWKTYLPTSREAFVTWLSSTKDAKKSHMKSFGLHDKDFPRMQR